MVFVTVLSLLLKHARRRDIGAVESLLHNVSLAHVCEPCRLPLRVTTFEEVYRDRDVAVGLFFLPRGSSIPPHDHPGLTVRGRVLLGRVRVATWRGNASTRATLDARSVLRVDATHDRVVHSVHALGRTAVLLDVLMPPYSRPCTYYRETADGSVERAPTRLFRIRTRPHRGPVAERSPLDRSHARSTA